MTHSLPQEGAAVQGTTTEKAFPSGRNTLGLPETSPLRTADLALPFPPGSFLPLLVLTLVGSLHILNRVIDLLDRDNRDI